MTGIFNLKFESRDQSNNFEYLFMHLETANKLKDTLVKYILPEEELNLIDYRLNNIPFTPSGYRFESFSSRQDNMIYRTEGIIGTIWEKIKAFFKWILDKIKDLFGLNKESPTPPPTQEFEKVEKKAAAVVEKTLAPVVKADNKDQLLEDIDKLIEEVVSAKDERKPSNEKATRAWLVEITKGNSSDLQEFTKNFVEKAPEKTEPEKAEKPSEKKEVKKVEKTPEEIKKDLEKQADDYVRSLKKLKAYNNKLYTKAEQLSNKFEEIYASSIPASNISVVDSVFGFFRIGTECLETINEKGFDGFISGDISFTADEMNVQETFHDTCAEVLNVKREPTDFFDFVGTGFISYKLDPSKFSLTKKEEKATPSKDSSDKNYKRLIGLIKSSDGKKFLDKLVHRKSLLDGQLEKVKKVTETFSKKIDGISEADRKNVKSEALTFIQNVCAASLSSLQKKIDHNNKTIDFLNELHEFEKLILQVDNFVQQPWGGTYISDLGI